MDPTLTFSEIPYDWRPGGVFMEVRPNYNSTGPLTFPARALIIAQGLSTSAATPVLAASASAMPGVPTQLFRADQGAALGGAGSMADRMCRSWLLNNLTNQVDVMVVPDAPGSVAASGAVSLGGAPSISGVIAIGIAGVRVSFAVSPSDTSSTMVAKAVAVINAVPQMPVVAAAGTGGAASSVVLTAKNAGEYGNAIDVRFSPNADDVVPPGVTATVTAMSGGSINPTLSSYLSAIATIWYTDIVMPWTDTTNAAAFQAELDRRFTANGRLDAHGYMGLAGTVGTLATAGVTLNSRFISRIGAKNSPTHPTEWAAALGAVAMFNLTNDPARQLRSLALAGVVAPADKDRFMESEQDTLLRDGISTFGVQRDGTVVLQRVITSYQLSSLGVVDAAWLDIMIPKVCTRVRYDWRAFCQLNYPRNKLADDNSLAAEYDTTIVTPRRLHSAWAGRCKLYEQQGWIEGTAATVSTSQFVRAANDRNRVNARQDIRIIGNLMTLAGALDFAAQA